MEFVFEREFVLGKQCSQVEIICLFNHPDNCDSKHYGANKYAFIALKYKFSSLVINERVSMSYVCLPLMGFLQFEVNLSPMIKDNKIDCSLATVLKQ